MNIRFLFLPALFLIAAQEASPIAITSPINGDVVSGEVTITGTTDVLGFGSSQLEFSYASDPTNTWFPLQISSQPVIDSPLGVWETSLITDGDYVLRLRVTLEDESFEEVLVLVRVQNDAPILTPTPIHTPTPNQLDSQNPTPFLIAASLTPTQTPRPTPTPLPTNVMSLNQASIYSSLGRGAMVIIGLFVVAGLILLIRHY